jgi:response regulator RpfG family c-di-GMP phosphodiesterase
MSKPVILCVDDESIILTSLTRQLKQVFDDAYVYEMAESADEAFEIIEELSADKINVVVIVSDWLMPGMKGDEFLIKVHQKFPNVVKILLTGQADKRAIERATKEANLHRYIAKPWEQQELINSIESGLKKLGLTSA